jgi:hypothetical protein
MLGMTLWDRIALIAGLWMCGGTIIGLVVGIRLRGLTSLATVVEPRDEQVG